MQAPPIITTNEWGARPPRRPIVWTGRPSRVLFHHTAGHAAEVANPANESRDEAERYARDLQAFHIDVNGWVDSGHNFLVCRNGLILVGRHESLPAVRAGLMVVSAHCPGQNGQPGVEHEHDGTEHMTAAQFEASARLHAWLVWSGRMSWRLRVPIDPHRRYYATACPGALEVELSAFRRRVRAILRHGRP